MLRGKNVQATLANSFETGGAPSSSLHSNFAIEVHNHTKQHISNIGNAQKKCDNNASGGRGQVFDYLYFIIFYTVIIFESFCISDDWNVLPCVTEHFGSEVSRPIAQHAQLVRGLFINGACIFANSNRGDSFTDMSFCRSDIHAPMVLYKLVMILKNLRNLQFTFFKREKSLLNSFWPWLLLSVLKKCNRNPVRFKKVGHRSNLYFIRVSDFRSQINPPYTE